MCGEHLFSLSDVHLNIELGAYLVFGTVICVDERNGKDFVSQH